MRASAITKLEYGVEVIHGLMGAGKSFFAVKRCVQQTLATRRPLYTNLPIKFPVMRRYLRIRGGEQCTNLIRRLDERHWRAFLERQNRFAKFREALKKRTPSDLPAADFASFSEAVGEDPDALRRCPKFYDRHVALWFQAKHGPNIIDGPDANWIPPTAIICIDEVQHWHPMTGQKDDRNREDLLAYLTMIRHHCQWLWVITQEPGRIAIEFRLLAKFIWWVRDRGEDRLVWGIRWKHIGLRAIGYVKATPDQLQGKNPDNRRPSEQFTVLPTLPMNRVFFRLYSSHTNIGSPRAMLRELRRARQVAGLNTAGQSEQEIEEEMKAKSAPAKPSILRRLIRLVRTVVLLTTVGLTSYAIGGGFKTPEPQEIASSEPAPLPPIVWPRWTGIGSAPWIDGRRLRVGDPVSDRVRLDYIQPGGRQLVLRVDAAEWWLWRWPEPEPIRVGKVEDVRAAVHRLTGDPALAPRPALSGPATASP